MVSSKFSNSAKSSSSKEEILLSVVIPTYNNAQFLPQVVGELEEVLKTIKHELIIVNDGSQDNTEALLESMIEQSYFNDNSQIIGINLTQNFSQDNATLAGFEQANGKYIVAMDDDGQNDPRYIFTMMEVLEKNKLDGVFASLDDLQHSQSKNFFAKLNRKILKYAYDLPENLDHSSFFLIKKEIVTQLSNLEISNFSLFVLITQLSNRLTSINVPHRSTFGNTTRYNFNRNLKYFFNGLYLSAKPFNLLIYIGVGILGVSLLYFIYRFFYTIYLLIAFFVGQIENFYYFADYFGLVIGSSVFLSFLIFLLIAGIGTVIFSLGVLGNYLSRSIQNQIKKPAYLIRKIYKK